MGNLYVTKGISEYYPLVLAHTDSVHDIKEMVVKEEYLPNSQGDKKLALKAYTKDGNLPTGIGGDDKAGVFICLQLLERFNVIKGFFPVAKKPDVMVVGERKKNSLIMWVMLFSLIPRKMTLCHFHLWVHSYLNRIPNFLIKLRV